MIETEGFVPFFGVVEETDDPDKLGRLQVRVYGYHTRNKGKLPTDDLPWMISVVPNSSGVSGIGHTPYNYRKGSTVFGYFIGRDLQTGIIIGSTSGKPYSSPDGGRGFFDPDEKLPYYEPDESDVNRLAREPDKHWMKDKKKEEQVKGIDYKQGTWDELDYNNQSEYPYNIVYESDEEGYVKEIDTTPGKERVHEWHKSGTYTEVIDDGTRTIRIIGDGYEITLGDNNAYVRGNCNLTVDANCNTNIAGDWNINVDGDVNKNIGGNETVKISGNNDKNVGGNINYNASNINLN